MPSLIRALRSRLGANIVALYAVQGLNYLLPLIVLPYLLRVLGAQTYGGIVFAQSLMTYAVVATDFGFNFSATRLVSLARNDEQRLARIFWSTLSAKALLLVVAAVVLVPVTVAVPALWEHWHLIAISGLIVLGSVVQPQWYFQGIERMRVLAITQVIGKGLGLLATFALVHSSSDEELAALVLALPYLVAGFAGLYAVKLVAPLRFYPPTLREIRETFASSWYLFLTNAATTLYVTTNAFLLGLVSGDYAVGLYSLSNKVMLAAFNVFTPVLQAIYPRAGLLFSQSLTEGLRFTRKVGNYLLWPAAMVSVMLIVFAPQIVSLLAGSGYSGAVPVLRTLGVLPLILSLSNLTQHTMIHLGLTRIMTGIFVAVGALNLIVLPALATRMQAMGGAVSLLLVESSVFVLMGWAIWRNLPANHQINRPSGLEQS